MGISLLDRLFEEGKNRREVLYFLALAHMKLGDYSEAKGLIDKLLKIDPQHVKGHMLQSVVLEHVIQDSQSFVGYAFLVGAAFVAGWVCKKKLHWAS